MPSPFPAGESALPDDLLVEIFSYLAPHDHFAAAPISLSIRTAFFLSLQLECQPQSTCLVSILRHLSPRAPKNLGTEPLNPQLLRNDHLTGYLTKSAMSKKPVLGALD